ncbi:hypothetical protein [Luteibacter aegosomatissinici]|uniref:hypothetical protein n=1 Tax=Luteibacter aegosomatissinici TaxID=2911539 RepID=UPI001FFBECB0|nr:hypothetical protein [Luteibacter aegosomatissinici]UPG95565.1 hypothetical protein L2Y97_05500 [Luteibacter aegosomatissinici]
MSMRLRFSFTVAATCMALLAWPTASLASDTDLWDGSWHTTVSVYGWLPGISASMRYRLPNGGTFINRSGSSLLSKLSGAFMMDMTVRKGRWGVYADVDWAKFSDENGRIAQVNGRWIGADAHLDTRWNAKGGLVTLAGLYTLGHSSQGYADVLLGTRYLWLKGNVGWNFGIAGTGGRYGLSDSGHLNRQTHVTDAVIGIRGRWTPFPNRAVFIPYYFDIGKGSSDRTQQYMAGIGYAFRWGDVSLAYRDLEYHEHGALAFLRDTRLSGPSLTLSWAF